MTVLTPDRSTPAPLSSPPAGRNGESRVVVSDLSWSAYLTVGRAFADRPGLRMTFDRGVLEIMTTSHEHEAWKKRLNRLIEALLDELGMPFESGGSMTFQREDIGRGLEPDDCYWIANEPAMRGRDDYDVSRDPPPDLAIEIEYTRSAVNRMAIYAVLRVPEVWRYDGQALTVHRLVGDAYSEVERSPIFPAVPVRELVQFVQADPAKDSITRKREFLAWLRSQLTPDTPTGEG